MHPGGRPQDRRLAPRPTRARLPLRASSLRSNTKGLPPDPEGDRHPIGTVVIRRWFNPCAQPVAHRIVLLDVRLGVFADRMTPALAKVNGRLATDLTQQSALDMRSDRFAVRPETESYRRIVAAIASEVRSQHDQPESRCSSRSVSSIPWQPMSPRDRRADGGSVILGPHPGDVGCRRRVRPSIRCDSACHARRRRSSSGVAKFDRHRPRPCRPG